MAYMQIVISKDGQISPAGMYYKAPHANVPTPPRKHKPRKRVNQMRKFQQRVSGTIDRRLFA